MHVPIHYNLDDRGAGWERDGLAENQAVRPDLAWAETLAVGEDEE